MPNAIADQQIAPAIARTSPIQEVADGCELESVRPSDKPANAMMRLENGYPLSTFQPEQLIGKFEECFGSGVSRDTKVAVEFHVVGVFCSE